MSKSACRGKFLLVAVLCLVTGGMMLAACREVAQKVVPYRDESYTIGPGQAQTLTARLGPGGHVEGDVTVRENDARFYIKDPQNNVVFDTGRFSGKKEFYFAASTGGFYTLYLDNTYSLFTSKLVLIHWRAVK
jgi:hypothetical protein